MKLQLLKVREARTCMVEATKRQVSEKFCLEMCVLCVCVKVVVYSATEAILQTFGELTYSLGKIKLQLFI